MLTKEKVINYVSELPDQFSIDDLVEKLILIEKIETGIAQTQQGMVLSMDEMKEKIKSWRK
jgi:hypothetical protein